MQRPHVRQCFLTYADSRLHEVAKLYQAYSEPIRARLDAIDEAVLYHDAEDSMSSRWMQRCCGGKLLQADRGRALRERFQKAHHALDDLYRRLCFFESHLWLLPGRVPGFYR